MSKSLVTALICTLVICGFGFSQAGPPPNPGTPGERLRGDGDIPGAIAEFEKVYAQNPNDQNNVYNLARALSINRQLDKCFQYLTIAVELDPSLAPLTDPDLLTARDDKRWGEFEDKLVATLNAKLNDPYKDTEYAKALWRLRAWDQAFFIDNKERRHAIDPVEVSHLGIFIQIDRIGDTVTFDQARDFEDTQYYIP